MKTGAYAAGMATGFAMQIWRSFLAGAAASMTRAGWMVTENAGRGITGESLASATVAIPDMRVVDVVRGEMAEGSPQAPSGGTERCFVCRPSTRFCKGLYWAAEQ